MSGIDTETQMVRWGRAQVLDFVPTAIRLLTELESTLRRGEDATPDDLDRISERVAVVALEVARYRIKVERLAAVRAALSADPEAPPEPRH